MTVFWIRIRMDPGFFADPDSGKKSDPDPANRTRIQNTAFLNKHIKIPQLYSSLIQIITSPFLRELIPRYLYILTTWSTVNSPPPPWSVPLLWSCLQPPLPGHLLSSQVAAWTFYYYLSMQYAWICQDLNKMPDPTLSFYRRLSSENSKHWGRKTFLEFCKRFLVMFKKAVVKKLQIFALSKLIVDRIRIQIPII